MRVDTIFRTGWRRIVGPGRGRGMLMRCLQELVLLAAMFTYAYPVHAALTELRNANVVVQPTGVPSRAATQATLPFSWDAEHNLHDGSADFSFAFHHAADSNSPLGLFFKRIGNRYVIWLNGVLIDDRSSGLGRLDDFVKEPHFYILPVNLLKADNRLQIRIIADGGRRGGLSAPVLGPESEVEPLYRWQYRAQVQSAFALMVIGTFVGLISLVVWWRQRERVFLYFAGALLCWSFRISDSLMQTIPMDWRYWSLALVTAYTTYAMLCFKFAFEVATHRDSTEIRLSRLVSVLYVPTLLIGVVAAGLEWIPLWKAWRLSILLLTLAGAASVVWIATRRRTLDHAILGAAFAVGVLAGAIDYLVTQSSGETHGDGTLSRYGALLMMGVFIWLLAERYILAQRAVLRSKDELEARLAEYQQELTRIYEVRAHAEREHATAEERQRITRDLHDGLGMQIATTLHLASRPDTPNAAIAEQLRRALEQLKLTVDALEDVGNDLGVVLGNIRFRLAARIESSGVVLHWQVDRLPILPDLTSAKVRHIQYIVLEAISNTFNHAHAQSLTLRAWFNAAADHVHIVIRDDGIGFDITNGQFGRGLANLQARADALGAVLSVRSDRTGEGRGTAVELQLPVNVSDTAPA